MMMDILIGTLLVAGVTGLLFAKNCLMRSCRRGF